jgi:hypothetical protein
MALVDIGNGIKQFVPDADAGAGMSADKVLSLVQLQQQIANSQAQGQIFAENLKQEQATTGLIPMQQQKLQAELQGSQLTAQKSQLDIAKAKGDALDEVFEKVPQLIRSRGLEFADKFVQARLPGVTLTQPDKNGGVYFNLPDGRSLVTNPNPKAGTELNAKDKLQTESTFADSFLKETEDANKALQSFDTIQKLSKTNKGEGLTDIALLYNLIKGLDPKGAVRDGDVQLTQGASSLTQRIAALYQNGLSFKGKLLLSSISGRNAPTEWV